MQKSIEVEYWVVDGSGELVEPGPLVDAADGVEEEFVEPLLELKTPPCGSCDELRAAFLERLRAVDERAAELDRLLVPLGTPVNGDPVDRWPDERARIQKHAVGAKFDYANYCAGTHLHFEQRNVTDQLNALVALDPALALCNTTPFFRGERVAAGARAYLYRKKSYEDMPKHGQLWDYVETVGEWERRLENRFEEFRAAAVDAGVDPGRVDEHFSRDTVVWTPVRLRDAMPTVEWRSPDAALPGQVLQLAEAVDGVMSRLSDRTVTVEGERGEVTDDRVVLPEFDAVRDLAEDAIHDGLASDRLRGYLDRMGFDPGRYDPTTEEFDGRAAVDGAEARDVRVRYGERLREDVAALAE